MQRQAVRYLRRGEVVTLSGFDPGLTLLDHLRLGRRATGTKEGCNEGDCGACTVVLARLRGGHIVYEPVNACILLAGQVDGAEVITIEDLAQDGGLHPIQQAIIDQYASQCGFCTPGIVMSLFALYHAGGPTPGRAAIVDQLAGNLCRCTGYRPIIAAAEATCAGTPDDAFVRDAAGRRAALAALDSDDDVFVGSDERFFAAPARLETLFSLLGRHPGATLIGGATDVGLWLTKKLKDIKQIIWLGRIADLNRIAQTDKAVMLGATVPVAHARATLAAVAPDLGEVVRRFGSPQVRASGTVGGNIANGSPIGDLAPCLIALGTTVTLASAGGERTLPLEAFFIDYGRQDRKPGEIVRTLTVPRPAQDQSFRAYKVSKRFDEDISAVLGAFFFTLHDARIVDVRIAFGGMAATPKRATRAEAALRGARLDDGAALEAAIAVLEQDFAPISDARASAAYRRQVAGALLRKAVLESGGVPATTTRVLAGAEALS